ncbi:uncharacterized protein V1516DRAFT_671457 [Lipomyces oligophaga]|uniref:uncharacterized protein n=1 Tax=Lipomyces oligophaga TaxID=45792 RepID=UPI0034CE21EB
MKRLKTDRKEFHRTLRLFPYGYLLLQFIIPNGSTTTSTQLDAVTIYSILRLAISQSLGTIGGANASVNLDILNIAEEGVTIRVPESELKKVWAALAGFHVSLESFNLDNSSQELGVVVMKSGKVLQSVVRPDRTWSPPS